MIRVAIVGAAGRMGQKIRENLEKNFKVEALIEKKDLSGYQDDLEKVIEKIDVVIDFSTPCSSLASLKICAKYKKPIVIGTTGFNQEQKKEIKKLTHKTACVLSPNMSIGVNLLFKLVEKAAAILKKDYDAGISEIHHRYKKDAPSGTALKLGEIIAKIRGENKIAINSTRAGNICGEHTVLFASDNEILELSHRALNRDNFAKGAVLASRWILNKKPGLYDMQDVLRLKEKR